VQPKENPESANFGFLAEHDPLFVQIASAAEKAFPSDPNTTLIKQRQLGEALAQHIAALAGIEPLRISRRPIVVSHAARAGSARADSVSC
jgi:hypothetical protein